MRLAGVALVALLLVAPVWAQAFTAMYAGTEDRVSDGQALTPNGTPDWHFKLTGLKSDRPTKIRVTNSAGGVWENPYNGTNWNVLIELRQQGNADLWIEPYMSQAGLKIVLTYADGSTVEANVSGIGAGPTVSGIGTGGTPQSELQYEIRQSRLPDIDTVENAERNGSIARPYTKDSDTATLTLDPGTTYYFTVIVKDQAGNKSVYRMTEIHTLPKTGPASSAPPTVKIVAPTPNQIITTSTFTLSASATDDSGGVVSLGIYLNGELVQPVCACDTMTYSWNTKPYKGRVVRIQASAKDVDGQITTVSTTAQVAP